MKSREDGGEMQLTEKFFAETFRQRYRLNGGGSEEMT